MSSEIYKPGSYPNLPPPPGTVGVFGWIKNNLFSSISNSTLTIISVVLIYY
jgi:general L-amino acid transport system permease protein